MVGYLFTDISGSLVSQAEKSFGGDYGFLSFSTHDIESPPPCEPRRDAQKGLLRPLPAPQRSWREISVDFITHLSKVRSVIHVYCALSGNWLLKGCEPLF
ncbi:zinc-binding oxidoreductase [Colletotrichum higginsianum]|nr:zinc-binding oxidoreductase [Colletotrichum higginsianum]